MYFLFGGKSQSFQTFQLVGHKVLFPQSLSFFGILMFFTGQISKVKFDFLCVCVCVSICYCFSCCCCCYFCCSKICIIIDSLALFFFYFYFFSNFLEKATSCDILLPWYFISARLLLHGIYFNFFKSTFCSLERLIF